jgi:hypothetical protein
LACGQKRVLKETNVVGSSSHNRHKVVGKHVYLRMEQKENAKRVMNAV